MQHKNKTKTKKLNVKSIGLAILLVFTLSPTNVPAQDCVNVSGGTASGSGGTANYSIGQVGYQTYFGTSHKIVEGVQQPYEISEISGVGEAKGSKLSILVYPNPASDYFILDINKLDVANLSYKLYELNGKLIQSENIISNQTSIDMGNLLPAGYSIKIYQDNNEIKSFIVIKSK